MKEDLTFPICITLMVLSFIFCVGYYHVNDRKLMAQNIDNAIAKGVDPLSVKCAYETNPTATCISYALNVKK